MKYTTYKSIHNWLGLFLLLPIIVTSVTGILWMHEKSLGLKPTATAKGPESKNSYAMADSQFTVATALSSENLAAVSLAMAEARKLWGTDEVEIEKFEIKNDRELGMIVKVVSHQVTQSAPYEFSWSMSSGKIVARKGGPRLANGQGGTDWAKIIHDLHTGAFFSRDYGFLWSDFGAGAIVLLGLTGIALYVLPILKKKANQKRRASVPLKVVGDSNLKGHDTPSLATIDH